MEKRRLTRVGQISGGIFFDILVLAIAFGATHAVAPHRWLQLILWVWSVPPLFVGFGAGAAIGESAAAQISEWRRNLGLFRHFDNSDIPTAGARASG
jgi:hypothetical protein